MILTIDTEQPLDLAAAFMLRELIEQNHPTFPVGHRTEIAKDVMAGAKKDRPDDVMDGPAIDEDAAGGPVDLAVARAMTLIAEDKTANTPIVKAALEVAGAVKVRELTEEQAVVFLEALNA